MGAGSQQTKGLEYVTRSFYSSICLLPPARGRHCESHSITVPRAAKGPALEQRYESTGLSSQKPQVPSRGHGWLLLGAEGNWPQVGRPLCGRWPRPAHSAWCRGFEVFAAKLSGVASCLTQASRARRCFLFWCFCVFFFPNA